MCASLSAPCAPCRRPIPMPCAQLRVRDLPAPLASSRTFAPRRAQGQRACWEAHAVGYRVYRRRRRLAAAASAHDQAPPAVRGAGSRGGHRAPPLEANLRRHGHATLGRVRRLYDARGRRAAVPPNSVVYVNPAYAAAAWAWADGKVQSCGDSIRIRYDSAPCTIAWNVHLTGGGGWRVNI